MEGDFLVRFTRFRVEFEEILETTFWFEFR